MCVCVVCDVYLAEVYFACRLQEHDVCIVLCDACVLYWGIRARGGGQL